MTSAEGDDHPPIRVILADANVLYSRVLRDYLLYAAAEGEPDDETEAAVAELRLPDEDDRHVLAAAVAVGADVLCTDNLKDFPADVMDKVGIRLMSSDALLSLLVAEFPDGMLAAHRLAVSRHPGATDESTLAALRRAGAANTADRVAGLVGS